MTPWTAAQHAPLSMGFPRQEYWKGLPFPSPGDLPHPGIEPVSPVLAGRSLTTEPLGKHYSTADYIDLTVKIVNYIRILPQFIFFK